MCSYYLEGGENAVTRDEKDDFENEDWSTDETGCKYETVRLVYEDEGGLQGMRLVGGGEDETTFEVTAEVDCNFWNGFSSGRLER